MGFETFTDLSALYAASMNNLMKQSVISCTSGTRPASPVEGMHIYETDTDRTLFYNGALWLLTGDQMPHTESVRTALTAGNTTSASYVDIPGTSVTMSFTKHRADTKLIATGSLNNWWNTSGVFPVTTLGVSINGTDYDIATLSAAANARSGLTGSTNAISGIAAGAITVKLRIKVGAGTFNVTTDGYGSIVVTETL